MVAANAAKQEKKLERDAQEAALADRIAKIKEMDADGVYAGPEGLAVWRYWVLLFRVRSQWKRRVKWPH